HREDNADQRASRYRFGRQRAAGDAAESDENHHRNDDGADGAEGLAHEDLDLEPGQLPEAAQHPQSLIEWPVSIRNTSSRLGSTVRKSLTRIRFSDRQSMTAATRSSPRPWIVKREPEWITESTYGISRKRASAIRSSVVNITVRCGQWRATRRSGASTSMIRPCSMIATRSHSRSASSIRCVVRNT